jgi:hypothetical protein
MANAVHGETRLIGCLLRQLYLFQEAFPFSPFVGLEFFAFLFVFGEIVLAAVVVVAVVFVVVVAVAIVSRDFADSQWPFEAWMRRSCHWALVSLK